MDIQDAQQLSQKKCKPCEGGVAAYSAEEARQQLQQLDQWALDDDGRWIYRKWQLKHFRQAMQFLNRVAEIAEQDQHHPDLHLTGYRQVRIELSTHAIGGLSENDFILAAKIDAAAEELGL